MKNFLSFLILSFLLLSVVTKAQWVDVSPLPAVTYNDIAFSNGNVFTAQGGTGVYRSTDEAVTWTAINNGLTDLNITSLLAHGDNLFAGGNAGQVFISSDNGANWAPAGVLGSNASQVKSIVSAGSYIFAGTFSNGIFRSSDNGTTWDSTSCPAANQIRGIAVSGNNIFAGAYDGGVYISTDNGTTWTQINNGLTNLSITGIASSGSTLYVGVNGSPSVFISTDNGANWNAVAGSSHFTGWGPYVQSVTTFGEKNVFAGTFLGGVYLSTDKGENWAPINDGFVGNPLVGIMAVSESNYIYIVESSLGDPYNSPGGLWRRALTDVIVFPPAAPVLLSPEDYSVDQQTSITLTWNSDSAATGYQCQISIDSTFATNIVVNDSAFTDTAHSVTGLGNSTTYFWRVRAYNTGGFSEYSAAKRFTTIMQAPELPLLLSPASNAVNRPWNETLVCKKAKGASQYHFQVSKDLSFANLAADHLTVDTTKTVALESGTKYYWRVESVNPGGTSGFAGPDSFTVMAAPSTSPTLTSPSNNATFQRADTLNLVWSAVVGASGYEIQLSDEVSFTTFVVNDSTAETSFTATSLKNLQKYYWRIRGFNIGGSGAFSKIDSFTTVIAVPEIPVLAIPSFRAIDIPLKAEFKWNAAALAEKYQIQVATAAGVYPSGENEGAFLSENVVFDTTLTDTTFRLSFDLAVSTKYYWHVRGIDTAGAGGYSNNPMFMFTTTSATAVTELNGIPEQFALLSNYPNPFNPSTTIRYNLPKSQMVTLRVYNILGQEVATLVNMQQDAGYYSINFDASQLSSGAYLYILKTDEYNSVHKMLLMK